MNSTDWLAALAAAPHDLELLDRYGDWCQDNDRPEEHLAALLRRILIDPHSDAHRLRYADVAESYATSANGLRERAEFIRAQVELSRWSMPNPFEYDSGGLEVARRYGDTLRRRERELFRGSGPKWWNDLPGSYRSTEALGGTMQIRTAEDWRYVIIRGFVDSITIGCEAFVGGACGRCERGWRATGEDSFGMPTMVLCGQCKDGRTPGLAAAIFAAAPVTRVVLTGKRPMPLITGQEYHFYRGDNDGPSLSPYVLPKSIWKSIHDAAPFEPMIFLTEAAALAALSTAAVALGRERAGLPALAMR